MTNQDQEQLTNELTAAFIQDLAAVLTKHGASIGAHEAISGGYESWADGIQIEFNLPNGNFAHTILGRRDCTYNGAELLSLINNN